MSDQGPGEARQRDEFQARAQGERRRGDRRRPAIRIGAVGDFHIGEEDAGAYRGLFARCNEDADILLLAGDLTRRGTPVEMRTVVAELAEVRIPIAAVLGNHDYEGGEPEELAAILRDRGVHVLDGDSFELNEWVGIAGTKGFVGGFGRGTLTAFGEPQTKAFVTASLDEVQKLEQALQRLHTPIRIALLHYAPIVATVIGESEQIFPFLGTDRLAEPLDRYEVRAAFHGHAHSGALRGATLGGVHVFNVSLPLLRREGNDEMFFVYEISVPESAVREEQSADPAAGKTP